MIFYKNIFFITYTCFCVMEFFVSCLIIGNDDTIYDPSGKRIGEVIRSSFVEAFRILGVEILELQFRKGGFTVVVPEKQTIMFLKYIQRMSKRHHIFEDCDIVFESHTLLPSI